MEVASSDEEDDETDQVHGIVQAPDDTQVQVSGTWCCIEDIWVNVMLILVWVVSKKA